MNLKEIVSITGKPGLYKIVARSNRGFIVESFGPDKKRMPVSMTQQVALLDEITIYGEGAESIPLRDVFSNIYKRDGQTSSVTAKDDPVQIKDYFGEVAPGYDPERVYISDMKKALKWYELLGPEWKEGENDEEPAEETAEKASDEEE